MFALCLESILKVEPALKALRDDDNDKLEFEEIVPTEEQFTALKSLFKPLQLIKATINQFQGDKHPTIHLILYHLLNIGCMSGSPKVRESNKTTRAFVGLFAGGCSSGSKTLAET